VKEDTMSKSNEAFSNGFEQMNAIREDAMPGERGGTGRRPSRMARTLEKYRAGKLISFDELKRRVLGV
jgi:hypothetical protein